MAELAQTPPAWAGADTEIATEIERVSSQALNAYREAPSLVKEHHNLELAAVEGGYGRRQLFELIQNGADELIDSRGKVAVVLTEDALYCANQGRPLSIDGVHALLFSHLSAKTGTEIGRFGLGFKSVLGITRSPQIFSRNGSIGFDPEVARERIEASLAGVPESKFGSDGRPDRFPVLRIAQALDPGADSRDDPVLGELMGWATTVVRLRRDVGNSDWLGEDMRGFPAEFLLFSTHVSELILDNRETGATRSITARADNGELILDEAGSGEARWRVFSTVHTPSDAARKDAGRHADREEIPLVWAVPTRRRGRGEFWAFFPTLDRTTLSGVINAPWKLNEDRHRIIEGPFNQELLEVLSRLVLDNVEHLVSREDPGVVLDLMPARGREAAGWADEVLTNTVNDMAGYSPSIPDQDGRLGLPAELHLHAEEIPRDVLERWTAAPGRPSDWVHPSVQTRERRPRVEIYMEPSGRGPTSIQDWLEALVTDDTELLGGCASAISVAAELSRQTDVYADEIAAARIVLAEDGTCRALDEGRLFIKAPLPMEVTAVYVSEELAALEGVREDLKQLGVDEVNPLVVLTAMLEQKPAAWEGGQWTAFWELAHRCQSSDVHRLLSARRLDSSNVSVRCADGRFRRLVTTLLPGEIIPENGGNDRGVLIDTAFHSHSMALLRTLGAVTAPSPTGGSGKEPWYDEYRAEALGQYLEKLRGTGSSPSREYLQFRAEPFAGPLTPLRVLSDESAARFTAALLAVSRDLEPWTFCHTSQSRYPELRVPHPVVWMVREHGRLPTSLGPVTSDQAVGPSLDAYGRILPVASISVEASKAFGLVDSLEGLNAEQWRSLLDRVDSLDRDVEIGRAYGTAAVCQVEAPAEVRARVGRALESRPPEGVVVTSDDSLARVLVQTSQPFVRVADDQQEHALVERWAMRPAGEAVDTEVGWTPAGEQEPLVDAFPLLALSLGPDQRDHQLIPCDQLYVQTSTDSGRISTDKDLVVQDGTVYRVAALEDRPFLHALSDELRLGLDGAQIESIVKNLERKRVQDLKAAIRDSGDDRARLLAAIGPDALRRGISKTLLESVEELDGGLGDDDIAQLALVSHGVNVLREYKSELEERGLVTPHAWAGTRRAVEFVRELGFGPEYAGFPSNRPAARLEVEGRPELGSLHDYQRTIVDDIQSLLAGGDGKRGLLSLPTGAGKTRVTIEALVKAVKEGRLASPILWVAQTGELCEQAVETWSEIWRAFGPTERLTISRLWSDYEAEQVDTGHQVVVATIAKLDAGVYKKAGYGWLKKATCLVVDEAHTSIGPSYTRLLEWQEMDRGKERVPLIGLTATPFRGTSREETERLIGRYGSRRLDLEALGGLDAYPHLQRLGILSDVDHELLPGSELELSAAELDELKRLRRLPPSAARALAADVGRNATLRQSLLGHAELGPILLFAASVEHAETMAALLVREGVSAAAISGETDPSARRHYIERFRAGNVQVLSNYGVLTAGFDAPKVRVVYVARPTYSPNLYQQMIGRGLRGPLNGGTDRCLLVNVEDNVLQFGERLAFHEFDYLWQGDESNGSTDGG